jgi:hypothetical protein
MGGHQSKPGRLFSVYLNISNPSQAKAEALF